MINKKKPQILISILEFSPEMPFFLAQARKRGLNLVYCKDLKELPFKPVGAIVRELYTDTLTKQLRSLDCPTVRFGALVNPYDNLLPAILPDYVSAGRLAAEHFSECQFKNVVFVGYRSNEPSYNLYPLYNAFVKRCCELGIEYKFHSTVGKEKSLNLSTLIKNKQENIFELVKSLTPPVGVFAMNDFIAVQICDACAEIGIKIPREVAVLGYGNDPICELSRVQVSSIDRGFENRCVQAFDMLQNLMNGISVKTPLTIMSEKGVVKRESSDILSSTDPMVSKALLFIWNNLDQNITVQVLAEYVGVPMRSLQRKFKNIIGRGVTAELRRKRLEYATELLVESDMRVKDIAQSTGYTTVNYFHRAFYQEFGMTPSQYRKLNC